MVELRLGPDLRQPLLRFCDNVSQLLVGLPEQNAFPACAVALTDFHAERHQQAVGFAAAPRSREQHFKDVLG